MDPNCMIPGDATLIDNIVYYLKAKGIFDEFRHECLADVDTKSSCQNLSQRVDGYTSKFMANETWHPDLNKNELRNKLRRHIDEAGFLAPGADMVVEQAINPKVYHYFLPKVIEVVHQYVKEQSELLNKKTETVSAYRSSSISEKPINDVFENKDKTQISDPIADILSFSFHAKTESVQHKHGDTPKVEKKKEEKCILTIEKNTPEIQTEALTTSVNETKTQLEREKDKIKKEDPDIHTEVIKKTVKDEIKSEKKKFDDSEITTALEENKPNMPASSKPSVSSKKDDKIKHKHKSQNIQKISGSSNEIKKPKKESSEKSSDKLNKAKPMKSSKESLSPTKISSSHKSVFKEEKGESSKAKSHDVSSSKTSESSVKKSKSSYDKKDSSNSKHKGHSEKTDKPKASKSFDKNEQHINPDLSNSEKGLKNVQYSSSYDSSQGSDQEKSASTKREKNKHFSKHATKEKSEQPDSSNKIDKKRSTNIDENPSKKYKNEKDVKLKLKDASAVEAAKISSRSNSFGSTSSVSSSSNASKDNLTSNSDEVSENSVKDKKKKHSKEKDSCQNSPKTLPPPPPPPPPSNSLTSEATSSAEMSSVEDAQSSLSESDASSSEVISEELGSDLELECKDLINDTLNESALNSSTDNINEFYDIFLYSSSSSEFEGYGNSPGKKKLSENELNMQDDVSISSVHTSDLSSFDGELSSDDEVSFLTGGLKKRLTLKEAQELIESKASLIEKNEVKSKTCVGENSFAEGSSQKSSSLVSSDDESPPSEPVRLLRRERKVNPRYSSSEYTSIFNCKKETFITKQSSPSVKSQTSSPKTETNLKKTDSCTEKKLANKNLMQDKNIKMHSDEAEPSDKNKSKLKKESHDECDQLNDSKMSGTDEAEAVTDKEKLFKENNKNNLIADDDKLKDHRQLRPHNNSKVRRNSHSLKRKLEIGESTPVKRPCSRSSVDSSSSEFAPNENKPFNSEKKDLNEEKKLNECGLKISNLNINVKKDLFNKQRTNNNGDILGQKDIFSKNSHSKVINSEKKTSESDTSNELNSL